MIASLKADNYLQDQFQGNYDSSVDNDTVIICDYHAIRGPYSFKFVKAKCDLYLTFP